MKWVSTILVFSVFALLGLGIIMLYSSTTTLGTRFFIQQLCAGAFGLVACLIAMFMDYRHLKKISILSVVVSVVLLVVVLRWGHTVKGGSRWIGYGIIHFQPSELAKLALVIFLAHYCEDSFRHLKEFKRGWAIPGAVALVVIGLIFKEPDRGGAIMLTGVAGLMLIVAGARFRYALLIGVLGIVFVGFTLQNDHMRKGRLHAWLHPEEAKEAAGYQNYQGQIALGSGGLLGLGLGESRQKMEFVPERHTDFILAIVGEELGFVATCAVVAAFIILVICATIIARRARDTFGMILATGITYLIGMQAFINIAVVTGVFPNKGMPLPFISYGCSNLVIMLTSVGILLSVSRFSIDPEQQASNPFETNSASFENA